MAPAGRFMMQVLPPCGHAVHEDIPDKVSRTHLHFKQITIIPDKIYLRSFKSSEHNCTLLNTQFMCLFSQVADALASFITRHKFAEACSETKRLVNC